MDDFADLNPPHREPASRRHRDRSRPRRTPRTRGIRRPANRLDSLARAAHRRQHHVGPAVDRRAGPTLLPVRRTDYGPLPRWRVLRRPRLAQLELDASRARLPRRRTRRVRLRRARTHRHTSSRCHRARRRTGQRHRRNEYRDRQGSIRDARRQRHDCDGLVAREGAAHFRIWRDRKKWSWDGRRLGH
ncbi:hypothetical protein vB_BceM_AP3_0020 [Burkholderia phage AP3]|uniref:Uncharacterized protein n=1 Tax=Burkholderia phage AP3 TaxID=1636201 RepID=A0A1S5NNH2_9CAUD|nr:hypothetical protein HOR03_gp20 [Burkholderia phage AP3]AKA61141.1 hypothetical protein vB_BceM_AP3_0020 [Burkholderia phage AP3]